MSGLLIVPASALVFAVVLCVLSVLAPEVTTEEAAQGQVKGALVAAGAAAVLFALLAGTT